MAATRVSRLVKVASTTEWFHSILSEAWLLRIRILRLSGGVIDGVRLSRLLPGLTYEIPDSAAAHLLTIGAAVETLSAKPDTIIPLDEDDTPPVFGGVTVTQPKDRAAEQRGRRARKRKP